MLGSILCSSQLRAVAYWIKLTSQEIKDSFLGEKAGRHAAVFDLSNRLPTPGYYFFVAKSGMLWKFFGKAGRPARVALPISALWTRKIEARRAVHLQGEKAFVGSTEIGQA